MMTPPLMEHNLIATNLQVLLNAALKDHDPTRIAVQRPGIEFAWPAKVLSVLGLQDEYRPEPDVAVVDYDAAVGGNRFTRNAFFLAEVISSTDEDYDPCGGERWIDTKVRLYQAHDPCEAIVLVEQERVHVTVYTRNSEAWTFQELVGLDDVVEIRSAGLSCNVGDLYEDTRWRRRPTHTRGP